MLNDPIDLHPEEFHARIKFVQRKAIQTFAGEKAGRAGTGKPLSGSILIVH